ncbi:TonB-dependent receptor [Paraburkholderia caballeronis]|uniref:Catecholate siderophore receptor n=1 Tax=Paraburkholderia caballeronis TaxID=416943 RepID=A0A1H7TTN7_9BURK|nr:TonB-dependent siderophore receptor [Paraburkholderia caballeronis]PXW17644.1 catecholate siderophore receptor [Paraburkholderia caballeronis]PXW95389.1 catecholate siderophore receptor [Paraburkholderia caballeronis]RAJ91203.1 catecholate siderophore receptor [Paraburkholderia caballeronis]TDV06824.1 catecholate siderophore receptor [Paraburkholderia caballeronis]TDV10004.1 catecholate siderophore receptor [Paraburkholderia caballeronis]
MKSRADELKLGKLSTTLCSVLAAGPALAQTTGTPPPSPDGESQLAPIQVSGQTENGFKTDHSSDIRFTAPLIDTPKSVSVIPQELIQSTGAATLTEALRTVPGITFGAGEGGNPLGDRPFLRGYDTQGSIFVDGMRDIGATTREVFNTERIEVIKGSDGAFGGRGGPGGSINITSKTPHLGNSAEGNVGLGSDSYRRFTADGNWQFADHAAFRLNVLSHNNDVAGRDEVNNSRWGVAPSIAFGLGTPTRVTASYYHLDTDDLPDSGIPYFYTTTNKPAGVNTLYPADVNRHNFYGLVDRDFRKTQSDIGTVRIEHDITPALTIRNTTRYTKASQDYIVTQPDDSQGNVANGMVWRRANTRASDVWSLANQTELYGEFHTGFLKHNFATGLELSRETAANDSYAVAAATGAICRTAGIGAPSGYNCTSLWNPNPNDPWAGTVRRNEDPSRQRTTTKALYAFDTIEITPRWLANVGLRVDDYSTRFTNTAANGGTQIDRDDTLFNYQFGLVFKPASNGSVYASIATSSTPAGALLGQGSETQSLTPGRGGVGVNAAQLGPEKNRSIEVGTKWDVLDKRLSLTGALFQIDTTNARVTLPNNEYAMVGGKRVQGLELGVAGKLTNKWQVFGGYTYLHSELRDNGKTTTDNGHEFPNTPRNSLSLWTTYDVLPQFTIGGGAFYMSQVFGDTANVHAVPSYWRFDATARYRINKHFDVQLNVQNLFNRTYFDQAYPTHYASIAPGRSAFVTMTARY